MLVKYHVLACEELCLGSSKALDLAVMQTLLATADDVIE
jgi:hypothetical protein